jgi:Ca2+:H+ antiporter
VNAVTHDGETTWFEGVLLVSIYVLLGLAFYFVSHRRRSRRKQPALCKKRRTPFRRRLSIEGYA